MKLTARQIEIVKRVANGDTQHAIADDLGIARKTVESHLWELRNRLKIGRSLAELVRWAVRVGVVCLCLTLNAQPVLPSAVVVPADTFDAHLAWDRSPSPEVVGYRAYFGTNSAKLASSVLVGNSTNATIPNLAAASIWYFAATAYDTNGFESDFSNTVSLPAPGKTNLWIQWAWQFADSVNGPWVDQPASIVNYTNPTGQKFGRIRRTETRY